MNKRNHQPKTKQAKEQENLEVIPQPRKEQECLEFIPQPPKEQECLEVLPRRAMTKVARQCEHIMINGEFCRAAALRGRKYCYFHLVHIGRRLRAERVQEVAQAYDCDASLLPAELPLLEDANSIQLALSQVIDDVLHSRLDTKRAGLILYALQTASRNLANGVDFSHKDGATIAGSYDDLEEDYQLGDTAPELKAGDAEEVEETCESRAASEIPHKPTEGWSGMPRTERDAPSQRLQVIPAAHMQGRKPPVFALVEREVSSG
jgi:hypothetical protein